MVAQYNVFRSEDITLSFGPHTACMSSICRCTESFNVESSNINAIATTFDTGTIDLASQLFQANMQSQVCVRATQSHKWKDAALLNV